MFRYIATIPPSNLAISNGSVTIQQNSFIINSDGLPIYYQFHLICTDFADYCSSKNIKSGKNYILLTVHTTGNPITANVLASNFSSLMNPFVQTNQIGHFTIQISDQNENSFSSVKDASSYIRQYFSSQPLKSITTVRIESKQKFTWFILPFTDTQDKNPTNNFIFGIKGEKNVNSPEFDEFKSLIQHSIILINYRFSLTEPFKFIKHLLKLNKYFENHSIDPQKIAHTKQALQSPKEDEEDEHVTPKKEFEFDATWDWREFIKKKDFKGSIRDMNEKKRIERELAQKNMATPKNISENFQPTKKPNKIDKQRLVYVAQKAAISKNMSIDTMDEILSVLDSQLQKSIQYESKANKEYEELGMLYSFYLKSKKKAEKKFEAKRQEYGHIHQEVENKKMIKRDEKIGFDDDEDFTIELLNEEIESVEKEIEYLKAAFQINDNKEEEEEIEEEEIEEIIEEEEEEFNEQEVNDSSKTKETDNDVQEEDDDEVNDDVDDIDSHEEQGNTISDNNTEEDEVEKFDDE